MLPFDSEHQIVDIEYDPTEMPPELGFLRNSIVDVRCTDTYGRHFIVEMQMLWTDSFKQRILFNASKAYNQQLDASMSFGMKRSGRRYNVPSAPPITGRN
jgi:hypothetical protein